MRILFALISVAASSSVDLPNWLAEFPDEMKISSIPILPGSHNSGTAKTRMSFGIHQIARQQHLSIRQQLESGIRMIDLRVRYDTTPVSGFLFGSRATIRVAHTLDTSYSFEQSLAEIKSFLDDHPTEFVVILLRGDWPPEFSFSAEPTKRARVAELANVLKASGLTFADNVGIESNIGQVRGQALLVSQWFQYEAATDSNVDITTSEEEVIPYVNWRTSYQVCDIWDDNFNEKISLKIDRFMRSTQTVNVGELEHATDSQEIQPRICSALPGSLLFTGVALDRTHGFIIPPGLTSNFWTAWFVNELETNESWRPAMSPPVPVGVVLLDFADAHFVERLIQVGLTMARQ